MEAGGQEEEKDQVTYGAQWSGTCERHGVKVLV
jgi:hypothetical protein